MAADFGRRFDELLKQAEHVENSKRQQSSAYTGTGTYVDREQFLNWQVKVRHLISSVCGSDSEHFKMFLAAEKNSFGTNYDIFKRLRAVFLAAKEDFEGGYLRKVRDLIQAEVFDSELEQANELLKSGYKTAAAVIAGVVLETSLRQLCHDKGLATGKLDTMNSDLAKAGVYTKLTQKQITALADIRNSAAHGNSAQFEKNDVLNMIRDVRNILTNQLD